MTTTTARITTAAPPEPCHTFGCASECYHCEKPIVGEPVTDLGDQAWLPKTQWRTWCSEDCHVASAEKAEAS